MRPGEEAGKPGASNAGPALTTTCNPRKGVVHIMAPRNVNRAAASAISQKVSPAASPSATIVVGDPTGYLCKTWLAFEDPPALHINPDASAGTVLAWCWGEVATLYACARSAHAALEHEPDMLTAADFEKIFLHRLAPLQRVMAAAIEALAKEQEERHD